MFCWIWNLKNCLLQSESFTMILALECAKITCKNCVSSKGERRTHQDAPPRRFVTLQTPSPLCFITFLHLWILSSRESWSFMCLYCIPKVFFHYFQWLLSECLFGSPSGFILNQKVRSCPWLLALLGSVTKQHEGVSHWAEWEWKWDVIELDIALCREWFLRELEKNKDTFSWYSVFAGIQGIYPEKLWRMALPTPKYLAESLVSFLLVVSSVSTGKFSCQREKGHDL